MNFSKQIKKLLLLFVSIALPSCFAFAVDDLPGQKQELEPHSILSQPDFQNLMARSQIRKRKKNYRKRGNQEIINSWKPYCIKNRYLEPLQGYFFNVDVGVGFLYFSQITADLQLTSLETIGATSNRNTMGQLQGKLGYNRTPAIELSFGAKILHWLSGSLDYLHQGGIQIQTDRQVYYVGQSTPGVAGSSPAYIFSSTLSLDAILARISLNTPCSLIWKTIAYNLYLALAVGPDWQTWANNKVYVETRIDPLFLSQQSAQVLKQKISANAVWLVDCGTTLRSVLPNLNFSLRLGAKFIGWGQARQIGWLNQQKGVVNYGLVRPLKVKFVYSFVPYLGAQWNF